MVETIIEERCFLDWLMAPIAHVSSVIDFLLQCFVRALIRVCRIGRDIAITDRRSHGIVRFEAKRSGVRLMWRRAVKLKPPYAILTVHVVDHAGYTNLCRILTESHRHRKKGRPRTKEEGLPKNNRASVDLGFVCRHASGLFALANTGFSEDELLLLRAAFSERLSLSIHRHLDGEDDARMRRVARFSERLRISVFATNAVLHATPQEKIVFDVFHAIREGTTLDDAGRSFRPNAEAHLRSTEEMARLFADCPAWLARSLVIADACRFEMTELRYRFPSESDERADATETPDRTLRRLTYAGALRRYGGAVPACPGADRKRAGVHRTFRDRAVFHERSFDRRDGAKARHLCAKDVAARRTVPCVIASASRRSILRGRRCSSNDFSRPSVRSLQTSTSTFEHERREEVIRDIYERYGQRSRGDGERGDPLSRKVGASRRREGVRARSTRSNARAISYCGNPRFRSPIRGFARRASTLRTSACSACSRSHGQSTRRRVISRFTSAAS